MKLVEQLSNYRAGWLAYLEKNVPEFDEQMRHEVANAVAYSYYEGYMSVVQPIGLVVMVAGGITVGAGLAMLGDKLIKEFKKRKQAKEAKKD